MKTVVFQVGGDRERQEWVSGREMEVDVMSKRQLVSHQARKWGWPLRDITTERDCWFQPSLVKGKLNVDFWEGTQDKISGWSSFLSYALFCHFLFIFFSYWFFMSKCKGLDFIMAFIWWQKDVEPSTVYWPCFFFWVLCIQIIVHLMAGRFMVRHDSNFCSSECILVLNLHYTPPTTHTHTLIHTMLAHVLRAQLVLEELSVELWLLTS